MATIQPDADRFLPSSLTALREAAAGCEGYDLFGPAIQTVFGAGPANARLMLIGEQSGDQEDRAVYRSSAWQGACSTRHWPRLGLADVPLT